MMMTLKRLRFIIIFSILFVILSITVIYSPVWSPSARSSRFVSYASNAIQDKFHKGLGYLVPSRETIKTFIPDRFNWSNWDTSDATKLEEDLINQRPPSNLSTTKPSSSSPSDHYDRADVDQQRLLVLKDLFNQSHQVYHPNGLYYVNRSTPLDRHPILELIENAQKLWERKLSKSSKTLEDCIQEYVRRYRRPPPYGFERWWQFAHNNHVILKDEYDQIDRDLKPFLAMEPVDLAHRSWVMANERPETFTISIKSNKQVLITGKEGHLARAKDLANLIKSFSSILPDDDHLHDQLVNLTFTKHDQPAVQMTWGRKQKMIDMANLGEYFSPSEYIQPPNPKLSNWANACPPSSSLYLNESNLPFPPSSSNEQLITTDLTKKSFIFDHLSGMEVCSHPESMNLHGFTSSPGTNNVELVPLFTFAKASTQSDVLVTPLEQYSDTYIGDDPDWKYKKVSKLLWRGSTTGAEFKAGYKWEDSQRARLHLMSHRTDGRINVLNSQDRSTETLNLNRKDINSLFMDTSFSGGPVQCDPDTCQLMDQIFDFAPTMGLDESYQYKYLIDVDGNGWSGRFHRLISTKSLVLKSTIFPEWYSDRVQPWVHYVPIKVDYSDLYDVMMFFRGGQDDPKVGGGLGHDRLAEKIATDGKRWAAEHWRRVDMAAYMFRLVLEWRRVMLRGTDAQLDYVMSTS